MDQLCHCQPYLSCTASSHLGYTSLYPQVEWNAILLDEIHTLIVCMQHRPMAACINVNANGTPSIEFPTILLCLSLRHILSSTDRMVVSICYIIYRNTHLILSHKTRIKPMLINIFLCTASSPKISFWP